MGCMGCFGGNLCTVGTNNVTGRQKMAEIVEMKQIPKRWQENSPSHPAHNGWWEPESQKHGNTETQKHGNTESQKKGTRNDGLGGMAWTKTEDEAVVCRGEGGAESPAVGKPPGARGARWGSGSPEAAGWEGQGQGSAGTNAPRRR